MVASQGDSADSTLSDASSSDRHGSSSRRRFLRLGAGGAAALTTGCVGWGSSDQGSSGGSGATNRSGSSGSLEGTTINMLEYAAAQAEATQEVLPQFEEETGISVNLETAPYSDLISKQFTSLKGDSGSYDVIDVDVPYWPAFVSNDWIQPLNSFIEGSNLKQDDFLQRVWKDTVVWGTPEDYLNLDANNIMGIPYQPNVLTLYYRKDLYEEAGLSPPDTLNS